MPQLFIIWLYCLCFHKNMYYVQYLLHILIGSLFIYVIAFVNIKLLYIILKIVILTELYSNIFLFFQKKSHFTANTKPEKWFSYSKWFINGFTFLFVFFIYLQKPIEHSNCWRTTIRVCQHHKIVRCALPLNVSFEFSNRDYSKRYWVSNEQISKSIRFVVKNTTKATNNKQMINSGLWNMHQKKQIVACFMVSP